MKNIVILDFDSTKEKPLTILKPNDFIKPETPEAEKKMIMDDISVTFEALRTLIDVAGNNGYADKNSLINTAIEALNKMN